MQSLVAGLGRMSRLSKGVLWQQSHLIGVVQLVIAALTISFVPLLVRTSEVEGLGSAAIRLALAAPVFLLLYAHVERQPADETRNDGGSRRLLVIAGVCMAANLGFFHLAIEHTTVANAVLLNNCAPLFIALLSWLRGHNLSSGFVVALAVAMLGIALLLGDRPNSGSASTLEGNLLGALAGLTLALYLQAMGRASRRCGTFLAMATAAMVAIPILALGFFLQGPHLRMPSTNGLVSLLILGLICHVGGQGLIAHALQRVPAQMCAIILLLQPIGATVLAWIVLGESQTLDQLIGLTLVILAIYSAQREQVPK